MGKILILMVLGLSITYGVLFKNITREQRDASRTMAENLDKMRARNIANSYAQAAINELKSDWTWRAGYNQASPFNETNTQVTVTVEGQAEDASLEFDEFRIKAITVVNSAENASKSVTHNTTIRFKRLPFAQFGLFSEIDVPGAFWDGENFYGPVHVNGTLKIGGTPGVGPQFYEKVTCTGGVQYWGALNAGNHTGFHSANNNFHAEAIHLENDFGFSQLDKNSAYAVSNTYKYMEFLADGRVKLSPHPFWSYEYGIGQGQLILNVNSLNISNKGILYAYHDIHIRGTLSGRLTVATEGHLYASDDIVYADDPRTNEASTDMLGLMCKEDFIVETTNGSNLDGCYIQANVYTDKSSVIQDRTRIGARGQYGVYGSRVQGTMKYTFSTSVSRYWQTTTSTVYDIGGTPHLYVTGRVLANRSRGQRNFKDYIFREIKIQTATGIIKIKKVVQEVDIPLNFTGMKENFYYDPRFKEIVPPGSPYTKRETKILSWHEVN